MTSIDYKNEWYPVLKPAYKEFDKDSNYWSMKYADRWTQILSQLPAEKMIDTTVLEVGCGMGRALSYFRSHGAMVKGIEPSDYAVANSRLRPHECIHGDFITTPITEEFDVVYVEQVLSHIPDYKKALSKINTLLTKGGVLAIEEPNDGNPLQYRLKDKGAYWITKDHANYWNMDELEDALEEAGFKVVYRSCTFPMELFELMGMNYIGDDVAGKNVHKLRTKMLESMGYELRTKMKEKFAEIGIGRDSFLVAIKQEDVDEKE